MANKLFDNVYFQLRHDTAANWESINPTLLEGEIGIELGYDADGNLSPLYNKIKIGDGAKTWNELDYTYNVNEILALIPKGCSVYKKTKATTETTDESVLASITNDLANGDIAVITTNVTDKDGNSVELQKSAYIYDGAEGKWVALNGNVDADKVILSKDFTLAGSYDRIGNITKTSTTETYKSKGMSVQDFLEAIVSKEEQPADPTDPTVSITLSNAGAKEVGSEFTPSFSVSFTTGSYTYGPDTGVTATYLVKETDSGDASQTETATTTSGSFTKFTVTDTTSYTVTVDATHSDGAVAQTNLGNPSNPEKKITGKTISATSSAVTGYRSMFIYVGSDSSSAVTGDWIRTNGTNKKNSYAPGELTIPEGTKRVLIAIPASKNKTLDAVIDTKGQSLDQKETFTHATISVPGANSYAGVDYDVWYRDHAGLAATTYKVTMK